jgi:hypothetical protein
MKRLYLDTNIFLQYRYDAIDWPALADAEEATLVIVAEVFREIEKHKDRSRERAQKRARAASSWIVRVMEAQSGLVRPGVRLALALKDPTSSAVEALGLSPDVSDDKILASILTDTQAEGQERVFVTADNLGRFKSKQLHLATLYPPDEHKLADEPDPLEIENRKLRQELDTRPKLTLAFKDHQTHVTVRFQVATESVDMQLDTIVEEEAERIDGVMAHAFGDLFHDPPSKAENLRYLDKYRQWLSQNYDDIVRSRLTFCVELELRNPGRGIATGIDVWLTLPEKIFPFQPSPVQIPPPPEQPRWRSRLGALGEYESLARMLPPGVDAMSIAEALTIRERDGVLDHDVADPHAARFHLRALKHATAFELSVPLWFADIETARHATGFRIGYRVHADNLPDVENGELDVKLDIAPIPLSAYHIKRK